VLMGKTVGFRPSPAQATDYRCLGAIDIVRSCYGPYSEAISQCKAGVSHNCDCTCNAGPGRCTPQFFRAHAIWAYGECCCAT
jgi:hypothetical protein